MSVIKGCLKEDSKELKKLVMMYWEVVKKYDAEGKLLPEMILASSLCLTRRVCKYSVARRPRSVHSVLSLPLLLYFLISFFPQPLLQTKNVSTFCPL